MNSGNELKIKNFWNGKRCIRDVTTVRFSVKSTGSWAKGHTVLFDVDVVGGLNIKKKFGDNALSIFIQPPSVEVLRQRLTGRGTDAPEKIEQRMAKAEYEMTFADKFDTIIVNDKLEEAFREAEKKVRDFLK